MSAGSPGKPGYHGGSDGSRNGRTWQARKRVRRVSGRSGAHLSKIPRHRGKGNWAARTIEWGLNVGICPFVGGEYRVLLVILQDGIYKHYTGAGQNLTKRCKKEWGATSCRAINSSLIARLEATPPERPARRSGPMDAATVFLNLLWPL